MSQSTISPTVEAVSFAQEQAVFRRSEDRNLKDMRRKNSFFSSQNLLSMAKGIKHLSAENLTYLALATVFSPGIVFLGAWLFKGIGIVQPVGVTIASSAVVPLAVLGIFLYINANKTMTAKRKAVAATRRAAAHLDRKSRPVLTAEHVAVRERLDELFLSGRVEMPMSECIAHADRVFALVLEDFSTADGHQDR
jgi:hypothetical protein